MFNFVLFYQSLYFCLTKSIYCLTCGKVKQELRVQIHEFLVQIVDLRDEIHRLRVHIHELEH